MIRSPFQRSWRTQSRIKKLFYATYMKWLLRFGYGLVLLLLIGAVAAFNYKVDDVIKADGVELSAFNKEITFTEPCRVVRVIAKNGNDVRSGELLLEIVVGETDIQNQIALEGLALAEEASTSAAVRESIQKARMAVARPVITKVLSPMDGVFWTSDRVRESIVRAGESVAHVSDYSTIEFEANLKGESVSQARAGLTATITGIQVTSQDHSILKLSTRSSSSPSIISKSILGKELRSLLNQELRGKELLVPKDVPLRISEVTDIEVESFAMTTPSNATDGALADLSGEFKLNGKVESGDHSLSAQIADLPKSVANEAMQTVENLVQGQTVITETAHGELPLRVGSLYNFRFILKVKASESGTRTVANQSLDGALLRGTSLERFFAAKVTVPNIPRAVAMRLRDADLKGNKVIAKVEVKTGSKPIALMLLKRS